MQLSRFELEVMDVIWRLGEASVREIQEALADRSPAYTTVQTIVLRLEQKGAVRRARKTGNAFGFAPAMMSIEFVGRAERAIAATAPRAAVWPLALRIVWLTIACALATRAWMLARRVTRLALADATPATDRDAAALDRARRRTDLT